MIQEGFSFHTTSSTQKLTNNYKEEINIISELNEDTPLVLDTNILLRLYCIPLNRKKQLIKFFQEKKKPTIPVSSSKERISSSPT